jgi:predicted TIM-barrel fold metal-dependent hydrolase
LGARRRIAIRPTTIQASERIELVQITKGADGVNRIGIISVDGHVKAPRSAYRDYVDPAWRERFDDWLKGFDGMPDGFCREEIGEDAQWNANKRVRDLETQGVVAEVVFSNGTPFATGRQDFAPDPQETRQGYMAYNRWLVDFCSEVPGRIHGQAHVAFDDVRQAVRDIHWAKDQGLVGILMPPLYPGSPYFFDPALDPIWAACVDVGLPISQHGGVGAPNYPPQLPAAYLVLATEHSFFSGRSIWQLILGGVFERFPELKVAYVETESWWLRPVMNLLDERDRLGDDWADAALPGNREYRRSPSSYLATNCYFGISPFLPSQLDTAAIEDAGEHSLINSENTMVGVDYPHPETVFPGMVDVVKRFIDLPSVNEAAVRKVLFSNAAELFHLDIDALQRDGERVGIDLGSTSD